MVAPRENENWLIDRGDQIIEKKAEHGLERLSRWERLVYCLWVADYSIRNSGDLSVAEDLYKEFRRDIVSLSSELGLEITLEAFAVNPGILIGNYDKIFENVCSEIRAGEPNA